MNNGYSKFYVLVSFSGAAKSFDMVACDIESAMADIVAAYGECELLQWGKR